MPCVGRACNCICQEIVQLSPANTRTWRASQKWTPLHQTEWCGVSTVPWEPLSSQKIKKWPDEQSSNEFMTCSSLVVECKEAHQTSQPICFKTGRTVASGRRALTRALSRPFQSCCWMQKIYHSCLVALPLRLAGLIQPDVFFFLRL
jgi:hypothetical protein